MRVASLEDTLAGKIEAWKDAHGRPKQEDKGSGRYRETSRKPPEFVGKAWQRAPGNNPEAKSGFRSQ